MPRHCHKIFIAGRWTLSKRNLDSSTTTKFSLLTLSVQVCYSSLFIMDRLRSLRASKEASPSKSTSDVRWLSPLKGVSEPKVPVAPEFGRAFAFVKDAAAVCGGSVAGKKFCLREKGGGCNHDEGDEFDDPGVTDDTLYVRAATKSQSLTTVYQDLSLDTLGLDSDFVAFLIKFEGSEGPFSPQLLFSFITRNDVSSIATFEEAMHSQREGDNLPMLTPSRRKAQSLLDKTSAVSNRDEYMALMSTETQAVEALMTTVENTDHPGGLRGVLSSIADEDKRSWTVELLDLWKLMVERVDILSAGSVFTGASMVELVEDSTLKEDLSEAGTLALRNRVAAMEATVGVVDENSDLALTLWENVESISASSLEYKANLDVDLNLILEQFQTQVKDLEMSIDGLGDRKTVASVRDTSGDGRDFRDGVVESDEWKLEVERLRADTDALKLSLNEGNNDGAVFSVAGKSIHSQIEAGAVLEMKLSSPYVPFGVFVTPHVFLEFTYRLLYDDMHASVSDDHKIQQFGLTAFDYWAGKAMQQTIPTLLSTSRTIPGLQYSSSTKSRIPAIPTFEIFGNDTDPQSIYYKLIGAMDSAETTLTNHIENSLDNPDLTKLCLKMLVRSKKFVEGLFKYIDITYRELFVAFKDKVETWDLVCFCVHQIFSTEFRTAVDIASGAVITRPKEAGAQLFYSSLQVMKKVEEFMATGVRNHPSLTSAMVRFVMVMSHKSASGNDMTGMMNEFKAMKTEFSNVQKDLTGVQKEVKDLKKKNEYLQGQVDKIKRVGVEKGWKFTN